MLHNQHDRGAKQQKGDDQLAQGIPLQLPFLAEIAGKGDDNDDFQDFTGLQVDKAEVDPAGGAHGDSAEDQNQQQQHHVEAVKDEPQIGEMPIVE